MITEYLNKHAIHNHQNQGITVCNVADIEAGVELAKGILYDIVDSNSVIYLSGGTIQRLYEALAKEEQITPGAVGMIDERFGEPMHERSIEKMVRDTKLLKYLSFKNIPFYSIIQPGKTREEAAKAYDEKIRTLHATFKTHIGLIGIGPDGHISCVVQNRPDFHNPCFDPDRKDLVVSEFSDPNSHYKERVGMTFLGLSMLDQLLVWVFGDSKQAMFDLMFQDGKEDDLPARFFKRPEIAEKTVLITDQQV
jgi:6-phosphogluconolactonase/glucosamine-6-phosphate isomerase/deaminase